MIKIVTGNIFDSKASALVNPVNCDGVMGKGLAEKFKRRYPEMFRQYQDDCISKALKVGRVRLHEGHGYRVISFPTKDSWRHPSLYSYIETALGDLREHLKTDWDLPSVALPRLGCGLGGLDWKGVLPMMEHALGDLVTECEVYA